jgi:hypothetical protein
MAAGQLTANKEVFFYVTLSIPEALHLFFFFF